jgi:hypothetical protein
LFGFITFPANWNDAEEFLSRVHADPQNRVEWHSESAQLICHSRARNHSKVMRQDFEHSYTITGYQQSPRFPEVNAGPIPAHKRNDSKWMQTHKMRSYRFTGKQWVFDSIGWQSHNWFSWNFSDTLKRWIVCALIGVAMPSSDPNCHRAISFIHHNDHWTLWMKDIHWCQEWFIYLFVCSFICSPVYLFICCSICFFIYGAPHFAVQRCSSPQFPLSQRPGISERLTITGTAPPEKSYFLGNHRYIIASHCSLNLDRWLSGWFIDILINWYICWEEGWFSKT